MNNKVVYANIITFQIGVLFFIVRLIYFNTLIRGWFWQRVIACEGIWRGTML